MAGKDFGGLDFSEIFKDLNQLANQVTKSAENIEQVAEGAGQQVGESFVDGIEQGLEDATNRIAASSLKINKAFKDLAKKITNQSIALGGISVDFSDIDINEADFQKKIKEVFEKFKIDNAIEFDSAATEKQFKNMLALHTKYALKLSRLQEQRPKLTSQASIKANAQAQLAIVDGLKEIQKILNQTSGMSIELPHVYFGDVKELRTSIDLIQQLEKGEERVSKQRDTNVEKIRKENKELKERNKILEEKAGPIEEGQIPPARKPRAKKPKVETAPSIETGSNALRQLKRNAEIAARAFEEAHDRLSQIIEDERKLDEQVRNAGLVDYSEKYKMAAQAREEALSGLRGGIAKKNDHIAKERQIRDVISSLKDSGALSEEDLASIQQSALEYNLTVGGKYAKTTKEQMDQMFARIFDKIDKSTLKQLSEYRNLGMQQEAQDIDGLIAKKKQLTKEHEIAVKAYNDAADASSAAHTKLQAAENGVAPEAQAEQNRAIEEQNAKLEERNQLINKYLEAVKKAREIELKYGSRFKEDASLEDHNEWAKAKEVQGEISMRTDSDDIMQGVRERIEKEFVEFAGQFDSLKNELGDPNQWLGQYSLLMEQVSQGALTASEAVAKLREEMAVRAAEEAFNAELEAAVAAEVEEELKVEQTQLNLAKEELKVEKEITAEKEKQYGYHAGKFRDDGFKAENLWQSTPGRSTGFYGTGTYMTDKDHLKEITTGQYGQRPLSVIDPDMYNLFDATNDQTADQLHQFLKRITNKAFGGKGENIKSLYAEFKALFPKEKIVTYEDFKALVAELQQYVKENKDNYPATKTMDSVSTKFMKSFGYEGIDTRGTKHADTTYGTVVYDLKEESIVLKEITDEMQRQEIIAGNISSVIEKQTSTQKNTKEIAKSQESANQTARRQAEQTQDIVRFVDNYGDSLDEVNNKLMQGTKWLDEQGRIIRLFHNSDEIFDKFDDSKSGGRQGVGTLGKGNYLHFGNGGKFDDPKYGRYQTQWYANIDKVFDAENDELSAEQINDVIDKFMPGLADGDKKNYANKFGKGYMAQAVRYVALKANAEVADVWKYLGYDAVKRGDEINIFDSSKIHRANDTVLDMEKTHRGKFAKTINNKTGKFRMKKPEPKTYETDSGQMSILPAVEEEIKAKDKLVETNDKVAKSQKKIKEAAQGTQMTIDDIVPSDVEAKASQWMDLTSDDELVSDTKEAEALDKVGKAADKAANSKKKFAKANKEVAASVAPSVDKLDTEADAMEDVGEAAKKTSKVVSEEFSGVTKDTKFSTRDYKALYDEMEAFAEQRKAENGYDLSRVSVNTDAHGNPLGATISYYKKATKETITETFKIDKAAQEAGDSVNRLVLSSRKATAGIADFEKATLQAINRQDQLIAQKNKTVSSLSAVLDPNSNRTLAGTDYEEEANKRIQAIKDEVAKLDQVDSAGERIILPEKDFLAIKRRIAELTQDARDFINASKNAEYAPTQLESHSVSSGNQYRSDQLKAQINEWKRAGIYVGDLKKKANELAQSVTKITKHEDLKKYLEGMKEARALAKLGIQAKKEEEEGQAALNVEYQDYIALINKLNKLRVEMSKLDPKNNRDELIAIQTYYASLERQFNSKYGDFATREDVKKQFTPEQLINADGDDRYKIGIEAGKISDKKRLEEKAAAQKKVNEAYKEYVQLMKEHTQMSVKFLDLDPDKDKTDIDKIYARSEEISKRLGELYNKIFSVPAEYSTVTYEDIVKLHDELSSKVEEKKNEIAKKTQEKAETPYRNYGKTTANSAVRKRDNMQGEIDALGVTNPEILAKMDAYKAKVQEVVDLRDKFANNPNAAKDSELVKQFQKASSEAERVRRGIKAVIDEEQRMMQMSEEQGFDPVELSADQIANFENEMINHAKATAQGRMEIKGWNDDHTKMYYTVTDSKGAVHEMTEALGQGTNRLYQYRTATKETGTLMQQIFKGIKTKAKELISFVIGGGGVYKVVELLRQGIQYVREIDLALTELKKVTDETEEAYDKFLDTAAKTGARLGTTISAVTEATATFAKLGYSMEQATEMAESAIVYKNVGDNIASTEDAADSIISTMKGFRLEASESMAIVDRFNEVGNRFAITSQGIGEALRLSASALSEGGNSLDESIGLITAANEVVNDPSSVGTALKTLTLRLRGSKTELEEMGEDVSDMATTTSQLQAKLLALTGGQVDIMLDANTFKNSTQILREMAAAWEDMTDIQRASALELMGGKRQANVLSALIQNFDTVEDVIETSANSAGSALKENERYLDSIQGKIDQFNNAMQAMWSNTLDSDMVKSFVALGTEIIKIIDKIGLLNSALLAFGAYKGLGAMFSAFKDAGISIEFFAKKLGSYLFGVNAVTTAETTLTQAQVAQKLAQQGLTAEQAQAIAAQTGLATSTANLSRETLIASLQAEGYSDAEAEVIATKIFGTTVTNASAGALLQETIQRKLQNSVLVQYAISMRLATAEEVKNMTITELLKLSFKGLGKAIASVIAQLAPFAAALVVIVGVIHVIDALTETTEELKEKYDELNASLSETESKLSKLDSELSNINSRIKEINEQDALSFTDQEELKKLKGQSAELKRQVELNKTLQKQQQARANESALAMAKNYEDVGNVTGKTSTDLAAGVGIGGAVVGGVVGGLALGSKIGAAVGTLIPVPVVGNIIGAAAGALIGAAAGGILGVAAGAALGDAEHDVGSTLDNMKERHAELQEEYNKAREKYQKNPSSKKNKDKFEEAQKDLQEYEATIAEYLTTMDSYYSQMDWESATKEQRQAMRDFYDKQDQWAIQSGATGAKSNAIVRIFGDEAEGGFAEAKQKIDELKENLKKAYETEDELAIVGALSELENFKLEGILSPEEVERLHNLGIYLYETEDAFKEVIKTESKFIDNDLEGVVKDINKISDGLDSLKSAFEEVIEEGALTAKTIVDLKEELEISKYADVDSVTGAWREYLDVMMSGAATTEEMTAKTEKLAQSIMEAALANENGLTPDNKFEYIAQLRVLGVENAEKYVDDLLQKNMVKELEGSMSIDESAIKEEFMDRNARDSTRERAWADLTKEQIHNLGIEYGLLGDISDEAKQKIAESYGVEGDAVDDIIEKLVEKQELEQQIADVQKEKGDYNDWRNGKGDGQLGFAALEQELKSYEEIIKGYETYEKFSEKAKNFNTKGWMRTKDFGDDNWYMWNTITKEKTTIEEYDNLKAESKRWKAWKKENQAKYDEYLELKERYDKLWSEGESKGYIIDGKVVDPDFQAEIDKLNTELTGIETEIDKELTVDVELKLDLQNKSELVDDIQNVFDTLVNAQKEYTKNGYISVDTLQSLLQLEPKYLDLLVDESGNLNLTKDALYNVARARITDMGIQSQKNILEKASALASEGSSEALREQITVMQNANEVGADFVEVEMAKIRAILAEKVAAGDLTQVEADAFVEGTMNQIEAVQVATQSALDNLNNSLSSSGNTAKAEIEDAFKAAMDYWENRLSANQSRADRLENEIGLLEKKGMKAGAQYYKDQMTLLASVNPDDGIDSRLELLNGQLADVVKRLKGTKEGSDEWWEAAKQYNDIVNEIQEINSALIDMQDAIAEINIYKIDEFNNRLDDLIGKLGTIRDLIAPNGEEDWFDDEGQWTEDGVAVLGTYVQELETYKQGLDEAGEALADFAGVRLTDGSIGYIGYKGNEGLYARDHGIHSEQEYYDRLKELEEQYYQFAESISDTEQSIVDMYESNIDAIEKYTETLVEGYNDYIDSVKEALDAERDLYDFKKNVQKQAKDISEIERRIASLSGSTNKADIAERRKLEAQLYESRESLNDTYYDHAKNSQSEALDTERQAYENTMTEMVEGIRTSLEEATANMNEFLMGVTSMVTLNADTVLKKYQSTELPLTNAITGPWYSAQHAAKSYEGDALNLMNTWTQNGFLTTFPTTVGDKLKSPWNVGQTAVSAFKTRVDTEMGNVVSTINTNVANASSKLAKLNQEIADTTNRAASIGSGNYNPGGGEPPKTYTVTAKYPSSLKRFEATKTASSELDAQKAAANAVLDKLREYYMREHSWSELDVDKHYDKWKKKITYSPSYAKGTMGTTRDEWAITDESWIGEEITLAAGKSGRLRGMMKGSSVLPSDISENLVEWGKLNPDEMHSGNVVNNYVNAPTNDVDVENSLTIDGKSSSTRAVHDSIKDTYELIEDTVKSVDSISQHYKPSVDEALTTPWVDASGKAEEFNEAVNVNYDGVVSHIDENKESLEVALNTPYTNVTGDINNFSQHAQKTSIDDVITHANEQNPALTTALSTGFNNAKTATDALKTSGTGAVNAVKDSFTNAKTGLIKALNDTTSAAQKTKQAIDNVPTYSGGGSGASVQAGQHYISSLGKNVTLSSNVTKWSSVATQALQKTGQYSHDNLLLLLHQMQTESSGNQNAINNWDINAKNGTPSKGLMQVIDPTFQAYAMNGYDKDIYDPLSNIIAAIRYTTSRYGSLSRGWRGSGYAKGTTGTSKDEWALTDEFGPELTMYATPEGTLSFMRAGSSVVPAEITKNLVGWGKMNPDMLNINGSPNINMISNAVNKPELNITFDSLIKAENITEETLPAVRKLVTQELNRFTKELNYALKGKGAR